MADEFKSPNNMSEELKPCPFCGSTDVTYDNDTGPNDEYFQEWIQCESCSARCNNVTDWNTRPSQPAPVVEESPVEFSDHIHDWFELSYAQYLTIPRSVLQSMPAEWQRIFVYCLEQLDRMIDWRPPYGRYWVKLKDDKGKYREDPLGDYQRGRRTIPFIEGAQLEPLPAPGQLPTVEECITEAGKICFRDSSTSKSFRPNQLIELIQFIQTVKK